MVNQLDIYGMYPYSPMLFEESSRSGYILIKDVLRDKLDLNVLKLTIARLENIETI